MSEYHYRAVDKDGRQVDVGDFAFWNAPDYLLDAIADGWADDVTVIERAPIGWSTWMRRCPACDGSRVEPDDDCSDACVDCNHGGDCAHCEGSGLIGGDDE